MANQHWYAKKFARVPEDLTVRRRVDCPCCNGKGERIDAITHLKRTCVACGGIGVVKIFR